MWTASSQRMAQVTLISILFNIQVIDASEIDTESNYTK